MTTNIFSSPVGAIAITGDECFIYRIAILPSGADYTVSDSDTGTPAIAMAVCQLQEYFEGRRTQFELPLRPQGTPFQQRVWQELLGIPYGNTVSYAQVAMLAGCPKGCRAVASAIGHNPICIVIPCHRVVGSKGLGGYSAGDGIKTKMQLLELEKYLTI